MLLSGDLSTRITIQERTSSTDALGQPVETWSELISCWADVRHVSGAEAIKGGADMSTVKASMRIRWRVGITPAMRVLIGSVVYGIVAVLPDMRHREHVDLVCEVLA